MPSGHIQDPRMNTEEKEFGILNTSEMSTTGRSKQILYLKDKVSRFFTYGTPVTFDIQKRKIIYNEQAENQGHNQEKKKAETDQPRYIEIEIATNVRANKELLKASKVVRRLNTMCEAILTRDYSEDMLDCLNFLMQMNDIKDDEDPDIY